MALTKASFSMITGAAFNVADYGAVGDGTTDDTAAVNSAILAAYLSKATVASPTDEIYQVEVRFIAGKDYKINGPILLPSGILLNGNGCRLVGNYSSASSDAYDDSETSVIETAYYNGTAIVTNRNAALATNRVVGSGIKNITFVNANCGINAIGMNEQCYIEHCQFSNVSAAIRMKYCFYLRVEQIIVRNSSQATAQYAMLCYGGNSNAMVFSQVSLINPRVGLSIADTPNFAIAITDCTFEEGKADSSTGILINDASYNAGFEISGCYFEGVRYGISVDGTGSIYGADINSNIFNNNEYSLIASADSQFRICNFMGNSTPDDGGTDRNLIEVSNYGNDIFVQMPAKYGNLNSGNPDFLTNLSPGPGTFVQSSSVWVNSANTDVALALSQPGLANQNNLNVFAYEGAQTVPTANNIPFCSWVLATGSGATGTITIDTSITYSLTNILAFNIYGSTFDGAFDCKGFVFGTFVSTVVNTGVTTPVITVSNNSGNVRIVITLTATSGTATLNGVVRHV